MPTWEVLTTIRLNEVALAFPKEVHGNLFGPQGNFRVQRSCIAKCYREWEKIVYEVFDGRRKLEGVGNLKVQPSGQLGKALRSHFTAEGGIELFLKPCISTVQPWPGKTLLYPNYNYSRVIVKGRNFVQGYCFVPALSAMVTRSVDTSSYIGIDRDRAERFWSALKQLYKQRSQVRREAFSLAAGYPLERIGQDMNLAEVKALDLPVSSVQGTKPLSKIAMSQWYAPQVADQKTLSKEQIERVANMRRLAAIDSLKRADTRDKINRGVVMNLDKTLAIHAAESILLDDAYERNKQQFTGLIRRDEDLASDITAIKGWLASDDFKIMRAARIGTKGTDPNRIKRACQKLIDAFNKAQHEYIHKNLLEMTKKKKIKVVKREFKGYGTQRKFPGFKYDFGKTYWHR